MTSPYNITMLANPFGVGLSLEDNGDRLSLVKGPDFDAWMADTLIVMQSGQHKPINEANRAYLHYVIDQWLKGEEPTNSCGEV